MTENSKHQGVSGGWFWIGLSAVATLPGVYLRVSGVHLTPGWESVVFGLAILGGAALLAWAAEAAQKEISQALALAFLALIAVLPEYAVDLYFATAAARDPQYAHYAVANMTGANRLLIGVGWAAIVLLFWLRTRRRTVELEPTQTTELSYLIVAAAYAFFIPFKGSISLVDTAVLVTLFGFYLWSGYKAGAEEFEPEGPAATICSLPKAWRRVVTIMLFLFPAVVILSSAERFAEGLVHSGKNLGIDEFVLVQWVAPLASEAPEMIAVAIFALKGNGAAALGALVSSKVNQWTLLIGTLPIAYSIALGRIGALPLDGRQMEEVFLTAAQTAFAIALISRLKLTVRGAVALFVLFASQLVFPITWVRYGFAFFYLAATLAIFLSDRRRPREVWGMLRCTAAGFRPRR
ncbi:MAG: sodium:calcium antiporter [Chloroflexi bacterium]|nr:sodium:calcium antiporter [Chloroflexota bacterium]